jgi:hemolysin III
LRPAELQTAQAAARHQRDRAADRIVHLIGVALAVSGAVALAMQFPGLGPTRVASLVIYAFGLLATFACSALYNLTENNTPHSLYRRLDHAAIFFMIAGTYTPLLLALMRTPLGNTLLGVVWTGALAGAVAKLFFPARFERSAVVAYLLLGWVIVAAFDPLYRALPLPGLLLLVAGAFFYSFGVIFHVRKELPYANAVWHLFVLAGAAAHFALIYRYVALA